MRTIEVFNYTSTRYFRRERIVSLWFSFSVQKHKEPEKEEIKEIRFVWCRFLHFACITPVTKAVPVCVCVCVSLCVSVCIMKYVVMNFKNAF